MGCVLNKPNFFENSRQSKKKKPRHTLRRCSFTKSMRMAALRRQDQAAAAAAAEAAAAAASGCQDGSMCENFTQASSRRSSLAAIGRSHVYPVYDFCSNKRDNADDDYLSQLDSMREQKRNEFEDFGTSPQFTLSAYDRLDFDLTPQDHKGDELF